MTIEYFLRPPDPKLCVFLRLVVASERLIYAIEKHWRFVVIGLNLEGANIVLSGAIKSPSV